MRTTMLRRTGALSFYLAICFAGAAAAAPIQVVVNGTPVQFPDQGPVTVQNRVLVPLRGVLEAMGAQVNWDPATQSVTAKRGSTTVMLAVGSRDASQNGNPVTLDVPATLIGGRVMVPLRFVGEALGADVGWMEATNTVNIRLASANGGNPTGIQGLSPVTNVNNTGRAPVQPAGNPNGSGVPLPVSRDVVVTNFTVDGAGPFHPGDAFDVTLTGTPGGHAFFTVGGTTGAIAMAEVQPGVYKGTYRVPKGAHGENLAIVGRLEKGGASSPLVQAPAPVTIAALPPTISQLQPPLGGTTSNVRPTIYALFTPGSTPIDTAAVHLLVNGQDVTADSTVTPSFVTYTPKTDLPAGAVPVKVQVSDTSGLTAEQNWVFTVAPREGIKSVVQSATGPLGAGDVLTVTMTGEPGGNAWFSIPGVTQRVPMSETAPGQYTGTYTARRGDDVVGSQVVVHMTNNGANFSEKSTAPLTIWTRAAMKPVITSPANGAKVGADIQVTGNADPDSRVLVTVTYQQTILGIFGTTGNVASETVTADKNGHFTTAPIPLTGVFGTAGVRFTITAVETDPAGQKSEPAQVEVTG